MSDVFKETLKGKQVPQKACDSDVKEEGVMEIKDQQVTANDLVNEMDKIIARHSRA